MHTFSTVLTYHDATQEIIPACGHQTKQLLSMTVRQGVLAMVSSVFNKYFCAYSLFVILVSISIFYTEAAAIKRNFSTGINNIILTEII